MGRGEAGPDDPQYSARGDSVSIYQPNGSTTHTTKQSGANSQISSTPSTNKTTPLYFFSKLPSFGQREAVCVSSAFAELKWIFNPSKNLLLGRERDARAKKVFMMRLCLLVTRLDAAAPGGASSNRRWGVDTAPGAPPQPPHQPRVIRHPIGRSRTGPRPPWVKRERAGRPKEGAQDQGWFSPRASTAHETAMPRIAEQNIHHNFLFSLSPFAKAVLVSHRFLCVF